VAKRKKKRRAEPKPVRKSSFDDCCPNCREDIRESLDKITQEKKIDNGKNMRLSVECPNCSQKMKCDLILDYQLHYVESIAEK
jgi:transcription elongation factor Elf1